MKKVFFKFTFSFVSFCTILTPQGIKQATSFGPREISIVNANTVWISIYDGSGAGTYPKTF
jgi:hypothetical protein